MNDEAAFVAAIVPNPADYAPRGVFADWLEERQDPRYVVMRHGSVNDAVALFSPVAITDHESLVPMLPGRKDVGPWQWAARVEAQPVWLPAVVIKAPLVLTCVAAISRTVEVWVRTPEAALETWQAHAPHCSFTSAVPPLGGSWRWVLIRGTGSIELILTIEDGRWERMAHRYPDLRGWIADAHRIGTVSVGPDRRPSVIVPRSNSSVGGSPPGPTALRRPSPGRVWDLASLYEG